MRPDLENENASSVSHRVSLGRAGPLVRAAGAPPGPRRPDGVVGRGRASRLVASAVLAALQARGGGARAREARRAVLAQARGASLTIADVPTLLADDALGLLVVNKPAGVYVDDVSRVVAGAFVCPRTRPKVTMLHRLDRDTSGCLAFATRPESNRSFARANLGGARRGKPTSARCAFVVRRPRTRRDHTPFPPRISRFACARATVGRRTVCGASTPRRTSARLCRRRMTKSRQPRAAGRDARRGGDARPVRVPRPRHRAHTSDPAAHGAPRVASGGGRQVRGALVQTREAAAGFLFFVYTRRGCVCRAAAPATTAATGASSRSRRRNRGGSRRRATGNRASARGGCGGGGTGTDVLTNAARVFFFFRARQKKSRGGGGETLTKVVLPCPSS